MWEGDSMLRFSGIASVLCCAGLLVACGGGNSGKPFVRVPLPTMMVELPAGHDLLTALAARGRTVTIQAGETEDVGGVRFSCPSGGSECTVTLTVDGSTVSAVSTGGTATAALVPPPPPPTMTVELPAGHDLLTALAAGGRTVMIQAGETEDVGGVRFSCPSGGSECTVTLTVDGSAVSAVSTGGTATAALVPPPPPPDDDVQLAGPAVLEATGTARRIGMATYAVSNIGGRFPGTFAGQRPIYRFDDWGLWAKVGEETLFRVAIRPDDSIFADSDYELRIEGAPSGSNPTSGSAVWLGGVRAYDAHPDTLGTPVSGDARIEANLSGAQSTCCSQTLPEAMSICRGRTWPSRAGHSGTEADTTPSTARFMVRSIKVLPASSLVTV